MADFIQRIASQDFKVLIRKLLILKVLRISILTILFVTGIEKVLIEYIFVTKTGEDILS